MTECGHGVLFGWHTCIKCGARDGDVIDELRAQNAALVAEEQRLRHGLIAVATVDAQADREKLIGDILYPTALASVKGAGE